MVFTSKGGRRRRPGCSGLNRPYNTGRGVIGLAWEAIAGMQCSWETVTP